MPSDADLKFKEPSGSNGIAIGPQLSADGHALLLINPHTSFFFRAEQQVTSDQGLNAYGASTWGQFFIYQGFNAHAGWMHTSTGADTVDEFAETIVHKDGKSSTDTARSCGRSPSCRSRSPTAPRRRHGVKTFTTYRTHHGPIVRAEDGKWIAIALMSRPIEALEQSLGAPRPPTWRRS